MNNIIPFPKRKKAAKLLPKKRIFYLGSVRAGNEETDLYAKRMRTTSGQRKWGIINYYSEQDNLMVAMGTLNFKPLNLEENTLIAFTFLLIDTDDSLKIKVHHSSPI